jgi:hypothetical protein
MSNIFSQESTSQLMRRGRIKTSNRVYLFWLSVIRGWIVEKKVQTPQGYSFGRLTYKTSWVLKPKDAE